jgi:hypothetical protein
MVRHSDALSGVAAIGGSVASVGLGVAAHLVLARVALVGGGVAIAGCGVAALRRADLAGWARSRLAALTQEPSPETTRVDPEHGP